MPEERDRATERFLFAAPLLACALLLVAPASTHGGDALPDSRKTAPDLETVEALRTQGKYADADAAGRTLLADAESRYGSGSLEAARAIDAIVAILYASSGSWRPEGFLQLADRAVRIKDGLQPVDDAELAISLRQLAHALSFVGRSVDAIPVMLRVLAIRERLNGRDHSLVGEAHNNLAAAAMAAGDLTMAREHLEAAIPILEKTLGPTHNKTMTCRFNLGRVLEGIGDYEDARSIYEQVMSSPKTGPRPGPGGPAGAMFIYGNLLRKMGETQEALLYMTRGLELLKAVHGLDNPNVGQALGGLGHLHEDMGDPRGALPLYEESMRVLSGTLGPRHPSVAEAMVSIASVKVLDDAGEARLLAQEGLKIQEETLGADHVNVARTLILLARLERSAANAGGALDLALRGEALVRDHFLDVARGLSQREAFAYEKLRATGLDLALTLLASGDPAVGGPDAVKRVWDQEIGSRALVLDEMGIRRAARIAATEPGVETLAAALSTARQRLSQTVIRGPEEGDPATYQARAAQARAGKERAERDLVAASARFRTLLSPRRTSLDAVAAALPDGSVLIAYVRFDRTGSLPHEGPAPWYGALVIGPARREPAFLPLRPAVEIERLAAAWRREVGSDSSAPYEAGGEAAYRRVARDLRAAVWDPLAGRLADARHVFIVPDGALQQVSFAALPLDEERYLVEAAFDLHYLSAERDLIRPASPAAGQGLLLLGSPDFEARRASQTAHRGPATAPPAGHAACSALRSLRFEPLPGAGEEIRQIEALWRERRAREGTVTRLTGADAGESRLKASAAGHEVLHLATHGFFMSEACPSGLPGPAGDPLLLSGLALAGANHHDESESGDEDDGLLTAEEMASLDLSTTRWVVLSACETGLGEVVSGEGVLGVRRSLAIAGASTVIMSLWRVEDEATRVWMRALYEARLDGLSTPGAVRKASLAMLDAQRRRGRTTHPALWAGFVAEGDWR